MKNNVDLTLNRVFGRLWGERPGSILRGIVYFPWESKRRRLFSSNDLNKKKVELFFTGSREERKYKRSNAKYEKMYKNSCDCCGVFINKYPWNTIETLCKNCKEDLELRVSEYPWDK